MRTHWKQANYLKPGKTQVTMSRFVLVLYLIDWVSTPSSSLPSLNAILVFFDEAYVRVMIFAFGGTKVNR